MISYLVFFVFHFAEEVANMLSMRRVACATHPKYLIIWVVLPLPLGFCFCFGVW